MSGKVFCPLAKTPAITSKEIFLYKLSKAGKAEFSESLSFRHLHMVGKGNTYWSTVRYGIGMHQQVPYHIQEC